MVWDKFGVVFKVGKISMKNLVPIRKTQDLPKVMQKYNIVFNNLSYYWY